MTAPTRTRQLAPPEPAVYTVAEVAALLDLSIGNTYGLVRSGQIPARRMGGRWVVSKRRFHAWLDETELSTEDGTADYVKEGGR